jgi:hypothetical protein
MKRAELEKVQGRKVVDRMQKAPARDRFGAGSSGVHDRREQRKRDQAAGLVPFAVKLPGDLVAALHDRAKASGQALGDLAADLLRNALQRAKR